MFLTSAGTLPPYPSDTSPPAISLTINEGISGDTDTADADNGTHPPSHADVVTTKMLETLASSIPMPLGEYILSSFKKRNKPSVDPIQCFGYMMGFLAVMAVILGVLAMFAAAGGASAESLRTHAISDTNAAAWIAVRSVVPASLVAMLLNLIQSALLVLFLRDQPNTLVIVTNTVCRLATAAVSGLVSAQLAGQPWSTGIICATTFVAIHALPNLYNQFRAIYKDELNNGGCCLSIFNLIMSVSHIFISVAALKISVPSYSYNLVGSGTLMGLFGLGEFVSIVDQFPVPM